MYKFWTKCNEERPYTWLSMDKKKQYNRDEGSYQIYVLDQMQRRTSVYLTFYG